MSISQFIEKTGLGSPIGGTLVWMASNDTHGNDTDCMESSLTLEGSIPAEVYTAGSSSTDGYESDTGDADSFTSTDSSEGEAVPSQTMSDDFATDEFDTDLGADGDSFPTSAETDVALTDLFRNPN